MVARVLPSVARKRPVLGPRQVPRDKVLGTLPVIAEFGRRLDIRGIVDRARVVRDVAIDTHGQVNEALVANRLTSPQSFVSYRVVPRPVGRAGDDGRDQPVDLRSTPDEAASTVALSRSRI